MAPENGKSEWAKNLALFSVIVSELIGCTGAGVGVGYWAWTHWGAPWWVVLLTSIIGLTVAMISIQRVSRKMGEN